MEDCHNTSTPPFHFIHFMGPIAGMWVQQKVIDKLLQLFQCTISEERTRGIALSLENDLVAFTCSKRSAQCCLSFLVLNSMEVASLHSFRNRGPGRRCQLTKLPAPTVANPFTSSTMTSPTLLGPAWNSSYTMGISSCRRARSWEEAIFAVNDWLKLQLISGFCHSSLLWSWRSQLSGSVPAPH